MRSIFLCLVSLVLLSSCEEGFEISISGKLTESKFEKAEQQIAELIESTDGVPIRLVLNSSGGDVIATLKFISGLDVLRAQGESIYTEVPSGKQCSSACVMLFAIGQRRYADSNSEFLVHALSVKGEDLSVARRRQIQQDYAIRYLSVLRRASAQFAADIDRQGLLLGFTQRDRRGVIFRGEELRQRYGADFINTTSSAN